MYGMKKGLKYIKLTGQLVTRGEFETSHIDVRPYQAVTLRDESGDELHFSLLLIPKRLDEQFDLGERLTFYLLRYRRKDHYVGGLYAVDTKGTKLFYRDVAIGVAKMVARMVSFRWQVLRNPPAFFAYTFFGVLFGAILLFTVRFTIGSILGDFIGMLAGCAIAAAWALLLVYPLIRGNQYAGINQLEETMALEGFRPLAQPPGKY